MSVAGTSAMHPDDMLQLARESGVFEMTATTPHTLTGEPMSDPSVPRGTIQPRER